MHQGRVYMPQHQQYQQDPSISKQVALLQQFAAVLSHQSRPTHDQHQQRQVFHPPHHLHDESPTVLHFNANSQPVFAPEQHSDHTQLACNNQTYARDAPHSQQLPPQQQELLQMLLTGLQQQQQQQVSELQNSHIPSQLQSARAVHQQAPSQLQLMQRALSVVLAGAGVDDDASAGDRHVAEEASSPGMDQGVVQPYGPRSPRVDTTPRSAERSGLVGSLYSFTLAGLPTQAHDKPQQGYHAAEMAGHNCAWGQQSPCSGATRPSHPAPSPDHGVAAASYLDPDRHTQLRYPARQQQHAPVVQPSLHLSHSTAAQPLGPQQHWLWQQRQQQHQPLPQPQSPPQQHQRGQQHVQLDHMQELQHRKQRQHQHGFAQARQQLPLEDSLQQVVLSYEMLALLTMIATAAVHSADRSAAEEPLPAASLGHEVLSAARTFLGALTRMTLGPSSGASPANIPHTSPLSPADQQHRGDTRAADTDTEAEAEAAAALCDMPHGHTADSNFIPQVSPRGLHAARSPRGFLAAEEDVSRPKGGRPRRVDITARTAAHVQEVDRAGGAVPNNKHGHQQTRQGRNSLMALLQALKDNEHGDPEEAAAAASSLDWTADAAHADQEQGRSRAPAARRPGGRGKRRQRPDLSPIPRDSTAHTASSPVSNSTGSDVGHSDAQPSKRRRHSQYPKSRRRPNRGQLVASSSAGVVRAAAQASPGRSKFKPGKGEHAVEEDEQPAAKKRRWVAGTHQWTSEDGLVVWPKATQITQEQRVFYVAFKWVQEHWSEHVTSSLHITDVPVDLYLDGQKVHLQETLTAKIRVYSTAAHLVVAPYGQLAALHSNTYIAGYAFDTAASRIRLYLSTKKPDLTAGPSLAVPEQHRQQQQQQPSSSDSAAQHTAAPEGPSAQDSGAAMQPLTAQEPTEQAIAATNDGNVAAAATQDGTAGAGKEGGTDRQAGCWQRLKQQLDTLHSNSNAPLLDATTINNTVLCISDALQLPDELLVGFPGQLMKNLLDPYSITAGASSALKAEAPAGGEREQQQQRSQQQENVGRVSSVHAALQLWYQQLCVAVAACDEPQVMMLLQQLSQQA